jgi:hypothetical protein
MRTSDTQSDKDIGNSSCFMSATELLKKTLTHIEKVDVRGRDQSVFAISSSSDWGYFPDVNGARSRGPEM